MQSIPDKFLKKFKTQIFISSYCSIRKTREHKLSDKSGQQSKSTLSCFLVVLRINRQHLLYYFAFYLGEELRDIQGLILQVISRTKRFCEAPSF